MGPKTITPIFVGGCVRSGTTMLGAMLGAHSECLCVPESQFKIDVLEEFDKPIAEVPAIEMLRAIEQTRRFQIWGMTIDWNTMSASSLGNSYRAVVEWVVQAYGKSKGKTDCKYWVDHTPSNIRCGPVLLQHFPDARMIHIVRDGRAVAASILPLDWGANTMDEAARNWMQGMSIGLAAEGYFGPERILRVRYEDIVRKPDEELQKICKHLNIDYQPQMAEGSGFDVPKYTAQQHALVGKRPDPSRIEAWKNDLAERQIEIFESIAGELLLYLRYDLCFGLRARKMTRMERRLAAIRGFYQKKFINRFRLRRRRRIGASSQ